MIRLIIYIALSLAVTAGAAWLISMPGTITIDFGDYRMQPTLGAVAVALIVLVLVSILIWAIIRRILEAPKRLARRAQQRRKDMGVDALSDGFIALQAGNLPKARQLAREAQTRLPGNAAAQLLEARTDLALGDLSAAREHYRGLISNPKTALAALSGLYDQARAQGRNDVAITFARKATQHTPGVSWAETALFDDLTAKSEWAEALEMVSKQAAGSKQDKLAKKHKQAVLNTALAAQNEETDPVVALGQAQTALKLQPDFVPAALISARIHISRFEARKAQSLLRRVWRVTGHPHVATLFANAQPGASAIERLRRTRDLVGTNPTERDGAIVLARAAIDAYEWVAARNTLAPFSAQNPSQGVCALMAEIEEGQNGDQGKAREWLSRAVRAPRDPIWIADGITADEWEPVSPVTGKLDAFEWRIPSSELTTTRPTTKPGADMEDKTPQALPNPEKSQIQATPEPTTKTLASTQTPE